MGGEHRDAAAEVADVELRRLTIFGGGGARQAPTVRSVYTECEYYRAIHALSTGRAPLR